MADDAGHATPPSGPQPSQIQTAPNLVAFDPHQAVPQEPIYFQRNDLLTFFIASNGANVVCQIRYRWLTPQGEIKEGQFVTAPFTGSIFATFPLYEGWLLSFSAKVISGNTSGQWNFLYAYLSRPASPGQNDSTLGLIWSGFISSFASTGWPGLPARDIGDGPGTLRSIVGSTPAAGAEVSEVVPTHIRWLLLSFTAVLTTSATVANRLPSFLIDDGVNILYNSPQPITQVASAANRYVADRILQTATLAPGPNLLTLPTPFPLKSASRIRTQTAGLQAGDQWSAPNYSVLEWGIWDS